ncbi:Ldh family oxidoreductase [Paraburkholderia sp.]|uniref:Ldh family oxidoreductase n=1 Tax=Paraburkholderia sp. TaxID=1926495 RepID=UPI003C79F469
MRLDASRAQQFCMQVLQAVCTPEPTARTVADHLVEADLKGVRSHGVLRLNKYVDQIDSGYIDNRADIDIRTVSNTLLHVDAHKNWGIVALQALVPHLAELASANGVAAGALVNCAHTGRIGAFSEALARNFMWGMLFGGGGNRLLTEVAPHGGSKGVFDTNPYAFSLPISEELVSTADFATSATAQGKVHVYRTNKAQLPEGWVIDSEGRATTDPEALYRGGAMLSAGAHKGYGMGFIAELFGDAALGIPHELNWFVLAVDLGKLTGRSAYFDHAQQLRQKIEACPPAQGFDKARWPGQPEIETETRNSGTIEYSEAELGSLAQLTHRFGIEI